MTNEVNRSRVKTKNMMRVAILSALGFILMFVKTPVAFIAPPFMSLDASDVPALIGGFSMGPGYAIVIQLIKNLLKIPASNTGGVGEISNFIVGATFVAVSSLIYRRNKNFKSAMIGMTLGVISMAVVATMSNYFVVFPLYAKVMVPMETLISMGSAITGNIVDLKSMMVFAILPFNLLKGCVEAIITLLLYKKISPILKD